MGHEIKGPCISFCFKKMLHFVTLSKTETGFNTLSNRLICGNKGECVLVLHSWPPRVSDEVKSQWKFALS